MSESTNAQTHHDSPIKSFPHSGIGLVQKPTKEKLRADLRAVMQNKITLISPEKFFEEFVPEAKDKRPDETKDIFKSLKEEVFSPERNMYGPITKALNDAKLCPEFTFVATPYKGDEKVETKEAVDGGLYPTEGAPQPTKSSSKGPPSCATNWTTIEMCIECKSHSVKYDPFDESKRNKAPVAKERLRVLGQILAYAQLLYDNQQRTSQFMLLFLGTSARIVYIDRSGIFATKKFDYKTDATYVVEFLWRLARLDPSQRGHDTTAERVPHSSTVGKAMKAIAERVADDSEDYAHVQFKRLLNSSSTWWRLTVKDELAAEGEKKERKFLVGQPHFSAPGVSGRGTRGYIALDVESLSFDAGGLSLDAEGESLDEDTLGTPTFVYLKDAWRVVHEDIDKEGDTLRTLNGFDVPYVPTVLHHGDLGQDTLSPKLWVEYHEVGMRCPLKKHSHYRLVVKEVGKPLEKINTGDELIGVIYCCVIAHWKAYEKGIIHRDISVGNILISTDENGYICGLLNDWELSKRLDCRASQGRQLDRTGTWQYLSAAALDDPKKRIDIQDELESFFHVILNMAIRFLPHNCEDHVGPLLYDYFEDYMKMPNGEYRCGITKMLVMETGSFRLEHHATGERGELTFLLPIPDPSDGDSSDPDSSSPVHPVDGLVSDSSSQREVHPINSLIHDLLCWFSAHYRLKKKLSETPAPVPPPRKADSTKPQRAKTALQAGRYVNGLNSHIERDTVTLADLEELKRLAKPLESHEAFLSRLVQINKEVWPLKDVGPDKRPLGGYDLSPEMDSTFISVDTSATASNTTSATVPEATSEPAPFPFARLPTPPPLTEQDFEDHSRPLTPTPFREMMRNLKRPSSTVDGLEPPSTPTKRVQRD